MSVRESVFVRVSICKLFISYLLYDGVCNTLPNNQTELLRNHKQSDISICSNMMHVK